jgi:4-aminobutyrate aminotransferase-like enzyme
VSEDLPVRAEALGQEIRGTLRAMGRRRGGVMDVRGIGMLIGLELDSAERTQRFAARALELGVIVGWTLHSDRVIRLAPPLNIAPEEMEQGLPAMEQALAETAA